MRRALPILVVFATAACESPPDVPVLDGPWVRRESALEAYCEAEVEGTGLVDVEQVYLPSVVSCENGGADFAALQAQAIAARSYLYYKLDRAGRIADGQLSIEEAGQELFELLLAVASGKNTWAEHWKLHNDLVLFNPAPIT